MAGILRAKIRAWIVSSASLAYIGTAFIAYAVFANMLGTPINTATPTAVVLTFVTAVLTLFLLMAVIEFRSLVSKFFALFLALISLEAWGAMASIAFGPAPAFAMTNIYINLGTVWFALYLVVCFLASLGTLLSDEYTKGDGMIRHFKKEMAYRTIRQDNRKQSETMEKNVPLLPAKPR